MAIKTSYSYAASRMETSPLTPAEDEWVSTQLAIAAELARAYTGETEDPPNLERLDETWMAWQNDTDPEKTGPNTVVNALGVALGAHIIPALGLRWTIVTDAYGTDLAVYGEQNNVTFFPANMVSKRLAENEPIFTRLHRFAVTSVTELRARSQG
jgi:Domain of unknown function (DUF3806)